MAKALDHEEYFEFFIILFSLLQSLRDHAQLTPPLFLNLQPGYFNNQSQRTDFLIKI